MASVGYAELRVAVQSLILGIVSAKTVEWLLSKITGKPRRLCEAAHERLAQSMNDGVGRGRVLVGGLLVFVIGLSSQVAEDLHIHPGNTDIQCASVGIATFDGRFTATLRGGPCAWTSVTRSLDS